MRLSVIVASCGPPETLEPCLEALTPQDCEVIVADASGRDPDSALVARFPAVRWAPCADARSLPELFHCAFGQTSGSIVGLLEARAVPDADWCARMIDAHRADARADVVCGPIRLPKNSSSFQIAYYLCEFAAWVPPLLAGPATRICDANACARRSLLEDHADSWKRGVWLSDFAAPACCRIATEAGVEYRNPLGRRRTLLQRFHYGQDYAARRASHGAGVRRLVRAASRLALPLLLTVRAWRQARRARLTAELVRSLPALLTLNLAWAAGEMCGSLIGPPRRPRIL